MVASLFAMPIIVLNMGSEMVYILSQRLQAQSVQEDKSKKVLQDVMKAMYSALFIQELFKPQEMYSSASTKQIFEKLAHSSIMRLNKNSMDKLYDLMTMGFKRQILSCNCPQQYLMVTLNHLESLKRLVDDPGVHGLIQTAIDKSVAMYANLSWGQFFDLKLALMRYLQDKKVKVSLFLQQSLQTPEGVLVLSPDGNLPRATEIPGKIRVYEGNNLIATTRFETNLALSCYECSDCLDLSCKLGLNLYLKDVAGAKGIALTSAESYALASRQMEVIAGVSSSGGGGSSSRFADLTAAPKAARSHGSTAKSELAMLADLLGVEGGGGGSSAKSGSTESRGFKINLFPDSGGFDSKGGDDDDKDGGGGTIIHFDIDGASDAKSLARYMEDLDLKDYDSGSAAGAKGGADDEDDLLALMDSAK